MRADAHRTADGDPARSGALRAGHGRPGTPPARSRRGARQRVPGAGSHVKRETGMRVTDDTATRDRLAQRAVELAAALLREARAGQTPEEHAQARKLARM